MIVLESHVTPGDRSRGVPVTCWVYRIEELSRKSGRTTIALLEGVRNQTNMKKETTILFYFVL